MKLQKLKTKFSDIFQISLLLLFFVGINFFSLKEIKLRGGIDHKLTLAPPQNIQHYAFGYSEIFANLLWLRTIQDFDYCDRPTGKSTQGYILCSNQSWLYKQLDAITNLSPHFYMPHATGPLALSVLITDVAGATKLFFKSVLEFPTDWKIHYRAAYHAILEENKPLKAAILLKIAADNGAPQWVYALAGRMFVQGGAEELGLELAKNLESGDEQSQDFAKRIRQRLKDKASQKPPAPAEPSK